MEGRQGRQILGIAAGSLHAPCASSCDNYTRTSSLFLQLGQQSHHMPIRGTAGVQVAYARAQPPAAPAFRRPPRPATQCTLTQRLGWRPVHAPCASSAASCASVSPPVAPSDRTSGGTAPGCGPPEAGPPLGAPGTPALACAPACALPLLAACALPAGARACQAPMRAAWERALPATPSISHWVRRETLC